MNKTTRIASLSTLVALLGGFALAAETKYPDKGGGNPIIIRPLDPQPDVYADESGTATSSAHADDADEAVAGTWADNGGGTPTANHADEAATTDYAPTADSALHADSTPKAENAIFADDVADCAGGPFLGGDCGDLRYDGRLGVNANPAANLDVQGDARIGSLQVGASEVHIGAVPSPLGAALVVAGTLAAREFVAHHDTTLSPANCNATGPDPWSTEYAVSTGTFTDGWLDLQVVGHDNETGLICKVPVPVGAIIDGVDCKTTGSVQAQMHHRAWDDPSGAMTATQLPKVVEDDELIWIAARGFQVSGSKFGGCFISWRGPADG